MTNIIYQIIEQINSDPWMGVSKELEICKGKNKLKRTLQERLYQIKRNIVFNIKK
jgi:hypothetical protein